MPVDQTGENVMFVVADGQVEAHIQIQYTGDPERFAWIVPVLAEPSVEVGSDLLFTELLDSTVPTFTVTTRTENCGSSGFGGGGGGGGGGGCGGSFESEPLADFDAGAGEGDEPDEEQPVVHQRDLAGSFEYVVLEGGSVDGVVNWLDENGFQQDEDAPQILQQYIDEGFLFVAFKLRSGHGVDQIHPIVLRYAGDEACVPLRLTRIAARDDMGVRTFFLGRDRVVPTNFRHVQLNPLKLDWTNPGPGYEGLVTRAVDEDGADGHAFVTEYAGTSRVVSSPAFRSTSWRSEPFAEATPQTLTDLLADTGLMTCTITDCFPTHPLVPSLLQSFVPPPPGVDPQMFYTCSSCYADWQPSEEPPNPSPTPGTDGGSSGGDTDTDTDTDDAGMESTGSDAGSSGGEETEPDSEAWPATWDTVGLAEAFEAQIIAPSDHAAALVAKYPYLTRMYTTLSPSEMTRDPLFSEQEMLPDVDPDWSATLFDRCDGPNRVELENGSVAWFTEDDNPPTFDGMPSARVIEEFFRGAPMTVRDNGEAIDAALASWNAEHAGPDITPDDEQPAGGNDDDGGVCACTSTSPLRGSGTMTVLLLMGLCFRRRRS